MDPIGESALIGAEDGEDSMRRDISVNTEFDIRDSATPSISKLVVGVEEKDPASHIDMTRENKKYRSLPVASSHCRYRCRCREQTREEEG